MYHFLQHVLHYSIEMLHYAVCLGMVGRCSDGSDSEHVVKLLESPLVKEILGPSGSVLENLPERRVPLEILSYHSWLVVSAASSSIGAMLVPEVASSSSVVYSILAELDCFVPLPLLSVSLAKGAVDSAYATVLGSFISSLLQ